MIVAAALCPSPPLLARQLTGQALVLPELRDAAAAAVGALIAAGPDVVVVAGPDTETAAWPPGGRLDLAVYAPALDAGGARPGLIDGSADRNRRDAALSPDNSIMRQASGSGPRDTEGPGGAPPLPLALGIGALLLDEAGYAGPRMLQAVAGSAPPNACRQLGRDLAATAPRVALLAMGDGTARRSVSAPGYLDERAEPFDAEVERAVRDGDLAALAALDPRLAADLMATGRPAWQVLAAAFAAAASPAVRPRTEIRYSAAPLGVAYLVATLTPSACF